MLLLRAIFSLFESPRTIRGDLPPVPNQNRTRDFIYGLIIGSAVLAGFFWYLYFEVTKPTEAALAIQAARERVGQMEDVESRPVSVSLTYFDDPSATAVVSGEGTVAATSEPFAPAPLRVEPRSFQLVRPSEETFAKQIPLTPGAPVRPTLEISVPALSAPTSLDVELPAIAPPTAPATTGAPPAR